MHCHVGYYLKLKLYYIVSMWALLFINGDSDNVQVFLVNIRNYMILHVLYL